MCSVTNSSHFGTNNKRTLWDYRQRQALKVVFFPRERVPGLFTHLQFFHPSFFPCQVNEGVFFVVVVLHVRFPGESWSAVLARRQRALPGLNKHLWRMCRTFQWSATPEPHSGGGGGGGGNVKPNLSAFNGLVSHVLANVTSSNSAFIRRGGLSRAPRWKPGVRRELWCHGEGAQRRRTSGKGGWGGGTPRRPTPGYPSHTAITREQSRPDK